MQIGSQVRVATDRGPLTGLIGTVEEVHWEEGRSWYAVQFAEAPDRVPPSALFHFKVWELERVNHR